MKSKVVDENKKRIKSLRIQYISLKILTYFVFVLPILILVIVKRAEYFPLKTPSQIGSFSGAVVLLVVCLLLAFIQVFKKVEGKEVVLFFTATYWLIASAITYLLANVFKDITIITLLVGIGIFLAAVFNMLAQNRKKWLDHWIGGTVFAKSTKNEQKRVEPTE